MTTGNGSPAVVPIDPMTATPLDDSAMSEAALHQPTLPPGASTESPASAVQVLVRELVITNKRGLHARAAAKFVTLAERFGASVDVVKDGHSVSARSIMGLMMLGAGVGTPIELRAEGWDAKEALDALAALVEAGFNEQG